MFFDVLAFLFPDDFDFQTSIGIYVYDKSGNIKSSPADTALIGWTPYGKVDTVRRSHLNQKVKFGYDAMQNRVMKAFIKTNTSDTTFTYYLRDAQGNVMAVYERQKDTVIWREQYLYGSTRLGNFEPGVSWRPGAMPLDVPYFRADSAWYLGLKNYELTDHLGNVTAALSDRKQAFDTNADKKADYYEPVVLSATDYYPFGFEMPGRKFNIGDYRYGFNGKEADRKGEWASVAKYDYGYRIYSPAEGRFLSVDPLTREYPWYSPYQFAGNMPTWAVDLDGLEPLTQQDYQKIRANHNPALGNVFIIEPATTVSAKGSNPPPVCCKVSYSNRPIPTGYIPGGLSDGPIITIIPQLVQDPEAQLIIEDYYSADYVQWVNGQMEAYKNKWNVEAAAMLGPNPFFDKLFKLARIGRKLAPGAEEIIEGAGRSGISIFKHAKKFGIDTYDNLRKAVGTNSGLQVHHLLEKRFAKTLGVADGEIKSIVLTADEHKVFTDQWRKLIGYSGGKASIRTDNATQQQIFDAAREVYKNYPDILKSLGLN